MDLQELSDRQEIVDVITRHPRAIDTRSWGDLAGGFAEGAIVDYQGVGGPAEVLAVAKSWVEKGLSGFLRYQPIIGQLYIQVDADSPGATAYLTTPMAAPAREGRESVV